MKGKTKDEVLTILHLEYLNSLNNPLFDDPSDYCIILDLIQDRIDELNKVDDD